MSMGSAAPSVQQMSTTANVATTIARRICAHSAAGTIDRSLAAKVPQHWLRSVQRSTRSFAVEKSLTPARSDGADRRGSGAPLPPRCPCPPGRPNARGRPSSAVHSRRNREPAGVRCAVAGHRLIVQRSGFRISPSTLSGRGCWGIAAAVQNTERGLGDPGSNPAGRQPAPSLRGGV